MAGPEAVGIARAGAGVGVGAGTAATGGLGAGGGALLSATTSGGSLVDDAPAPALDT
ncbi:MAG TPA: hypothetical protein VEX18_04920 [Polyangiaceae bacterium]|nr:hypothetical protein [Polyangiaceae bacterium]